MKYFLKLFCFLLIGSFLFTSCYIHINTDGSEDINKGDTSVFAPFKIQDFEGSKIFYSPADIPVQVINATNVRQVIPLNKLTWVMVWAPHCQPCREKMPDVFETYHKHEMDGLSLVLISEDYEQKFIKKTMLKYGYDKPEYVLSATDYSRRIVKKTERFRNDLCPECAVREFQGYPLNFIYDKNMKLLYHGSGEVSPHTMDSLCEKSRR